MPAAVFFDSFFAMCLPNDWILRPIVEVFLWIAWIEPLCCLGGGGGRVAYIWSPQSRCFLAGSGHCAYSWWLILIVCVLTWAWCLPQGLIECAAPSVRESKDVSSQSLPLLLRCLKIMENATFLSKENQVCCITLFSYGTFEVFSPHTPHKRELFGSCCCCCCTFEVFYFSCFSLTVAAS